MQKTYYVYVLIVKGTEEVFYVGMTTNPAERQKRHIAAAKKGCLIAVNRRIRFLWSQRKNFIMERRFRFTDKNKALRLEAKLIACYGLDNLTNILSGGDWITRNEARPRKYAEELKSGARQSTIKSFANS